jgi:CubicO group peptidase (beta-lactamase class C family)
MLLVADIQKRFRSAARQVYALEAARLSFMAHSEYSRPPAFESGAGGLVSTADDYYTFCQTMLNKGVWGRERLLAANSPRASPRDR